jgi:hypothetical protein
MGTLIRNNELIREHKISQQLSVLKGISESVKSPLFSVGKDYRYTCFNEAHVNSFNKNKTLL